MKLLGHISEDRTREETLEDHSIRTARSCADACRATGMAHFGELLGVLHDAGKASNAFQDYIRHPDPALRGKINHAACGARYLYEALCQQDAITAELGAAAICGHHSGLPDMLTIQGEDGLAKRLYPESVDSYETDIAAFCAQCTERAPLRDLLICGAEEVDRFLSRIVAFTQKLPNGGEAQRFFMLGLAARYLHSALIDADRYQAYLFECGASETETVPENRADDALWERLSKRLEQRTASFAADTPLNQARAAISDACDRFAANGPGIYQLYVPTGGGKTLSSFRFALRAAELHGYDHVYYVAPYCTILEQNAQVIREILQENSAVLEHHSNVLFEDEEKEDEITRYQLLTQRWDCPVVFTTMVQFLNTLFDGRSACSRRFHALANSVILLDEVQSVPVKFTSMLNTALNFLANLCGCTVVLCTATQPSLEEVPIPVALSEPRQMVPRELVELPCFIRTKIVDKTVERDYDARSLADFAAAEQAKAGSILVVLNTKEAVTKAYREMVKRTVGQNISVFFLTTMLCPAHRMVRFTQLREKLKRREPVICISTPLIEAGVDISFGCVVRSLAGLPSIAQAAGRCNRNGELPCGMVYVLKCAEEDVGRLPDIQAGRKAMNSFLTEFHKHPEQFGGDMLSPGSIQAYYQRYYHEQQLQMDYPVEDGKIQNLTYATTLYRLLSQNDVANKYACDTGKELPHHYVRHAFQSAGGAVEVIESAGVDVLVPYGEGKALIAKLAGNLPIQEHKRLLRRAQQYMVHVFDWQKIGLMEKGALYQLGDNGVYALREEYYDDDLGVVNERKPMAALLI